MTNTVKIKVAVAISSDGEWQAVGWRPTFPVCPGNMKQAATDKLMEENPVRGFVVHWVTAEIPIPEGAEVAGAMDSESGVQP